MTRGEAYVLEGVRTGRAKASPRGALAAVPPVRLVTALLDELGRRGVDPAGVDDLLLGCATQVAEQGTNLARTAALLASWPVPGATVNRFCASGLDACATAAARVRSGEVDLVVAGGVESVSRVPMFSDGGPLYTDPAVMSEVGSVHMGIAADLVATLEGYERGELEAYALATRERARRAWGEGVHARTVVPLHAPGSAAAFAVDELVGWQPTAAELAALEPSFAELGASGQAAVACARAGVPALRHVHTRGTSPALADAAALVVVGGAAAASRLGLRPRARVVSTAVVAGDPVVMLTAGQEAAERALRRVDLTPRDVDVHVFAEAFSALCLRYQRRLGVGAERFNPWGGTMAQGHAFGATGAVLLLEAVDLLEHLGARRALVSVSGAAGVGVAVLLERV